MGKARDPGPDRLVGQRDVAGTGPGPGLIHRHDLMAALNRAAQKRVTIISAPAGTGKTSLLRAWADHPGQDCHIAFTTVRPGQHDMQLYGLSKAATGADGELQAAAAELQPVTVQPATVQPREELVARAAAARPCRYC